MHTTKGKCKMLFVILTLLVVAGVLSPYISVAVKRKKMIKRIVSVARASGFRVRALHRLVCFSFNRADGFDLLIENREQAFAVKLWSTARKNSVLVIRGDGSFYETQSVPEPFAPGEKPEHQLRGRAKSVPITKQNFKLKKGKPITAIMLYYPSNKEAVVDFGNGRIAQLEMGDRVFDKILCSPARLEKMLKSNAPESAQAVQTVAQ